MINTTKPARLSTLLLFACLASSLAAAADRPSSLKLVGKSNARSLDARAEEYLVDDGSADAPALSPQAPPQAPQLGDEILGEPLAPSSRRATAGPQQQRQQGYSEQDSGYAADPNNGTSGYPDEQQPHGDGYYGAPGPGVHLQRHADRLRNYIDNRPRQMPLQSESWLNKPLAFSYYLGGMWLDNPIHGVVGGDTGVTYGGRFSWDFAPKWGVETRLGGANIGITNKLNSTDLSPAKIFQADIDWLWYFTGDTRWRPFVLIGTGLFDIDYTDGVPLRHHSTVMQLPIGVGLKYRHSTRVAMRVDLIDNIGFASGVQDTMHNWSLTAGIEARFGGGRKRNYWPWNPSREWW